MKERTNERIKLCFKNNVYCGLTDNLSLNSKIAKTPQQTLSNGFQTNYNLV